MSRRIVFMALPCLLVLLAGFQPLHADWTENGVQVLGNWLSMADTRLVSDGAGGAAAEY